MPTFEPRHVPAFTLVLAGAASLGACFQSAAPEAVDRHGTPITADVDEESDELPVDQSAEEPIDGCGCIVVDGVVLDPVLDDYAFEDDEDDAFLAPEADPPGGDPPKNCNAERKAANDCVSREMKKKYPKLGGIPAKTPPDIYNQLVTGPCKADYDKYKECIKDLPGGPTTPGPSNFKPPYHIYYNSCHQAANIGVENGATGVLLCSIGTYYQHHTVNYWQGGCTAQQAADAKLELASCQRLCITNPQSSSTAPDPDACCWAQQTGTAPNITSGDGEACSKKFCTDQQVGQQVCLPPGIGVVIDLPSDCKDESTGVVSSTVCRSCCLREANKIVSANDQTDPWKQQREQFLKDCNAECDKVTCPNNVHYQEKNGVCLPSCGAAGGNTCAATLNGCRNGGGTLSGKFYDSYDCNYCCVL